MIGKTLWCLLAMFAFGTAIQAQEAEEDNVGNYYDELDGDKDGKLTKAEMRKASLAELGDEAPERAKLVAYGSYLIDHVLADADDDGIVTKPEFRKYIEDMSEDRKTRFSKHDWKVMVAEYLDPYIAESMKLADKDKDGALSKAEALTLDDVDESDWDIMDANADGKLTGDEYKEVYKGMLRDAYDVEEDAAEITPESVPNDVKEEFAQFDTDGNGAITKAEYKAVRTKERNDKGFWWGAFIRFLGMDANDDLKVELLEYYTFTKEEIDKKKHTLYPADKKEAMALIWGDIDGDEDGKVTKAEYEKTFPSSGGYKSADEYDAMDGDKDGDLTKDEMWDSLIEQFSTTYQYSKTERTSSTTTETPEKPAVGGDTDKSAYALYTKVGRNWTIKSTTTIQGMDPMVSYMKYEITEATDTYAKMKFSMLDKDKKAMAGMEPSETRIEFKTAEPSGETPKDVPEMTEETITVEAGEFLCMVVRTESGGTKSSTWMSKKYPGLMVKMTSEGMANTTAELVEFND